MNEYNKEDQNFNNKNQDFNENNQHDNNHNKKHNYKVLVDDPFNNRDIILNVIKKQSRST